MNRYRKLVLFYAKTERGLFKMWWSYISCADNEPVVVSFFAFRAKTHYGKWRQMMRASKYTVARKGKKEWTRLTQTR